MVVISLPFLWRRRLFQWRSIRRWRYEFGADKHVFEVPEARRADVNHRTTVRIANRNHDLWVVKGRLYRPVVRPDAEDASLDDIRHASTEELLQRHDELGGKAFWRDHPCAIARAHWAPEEPYFSSKVSPGEPFRFWQVDMDDRVPAQVCLLSSLAAHLVMDDRLWRPTSAPGWKVSRSGRSIARWIEGISIESVANAVYDAGDKEAALRRAAGAPKRVPSPLKIEGVSIDACKCADLHTVRLCLEMISAESDGAIAAYGPPIARLYWAGRLALESQQVARALLWLDDMIVELRDHANKNLAALSGLIEQRSAARFDFSYVR